jgi:carboxypeptidase C (cathepsin A)
MGIEEDAEILGAFIGRYLTQERRWASPVFLADESYGGFRVGLLSERLFAVEGIAPSGPVLISPVLDFGLIRSAEVRGNLRRTPNPNPAMRVLVSHDIHDLVTPYFASAISLIQMGLDPELKPNVRIVLYLGGHMFYTRHESRERLHEDAARFYRKASTKPAVSATAPATGRK